MYSVKELVEFCDKRLKLMGISRPELFRRAGLSSTLFTMAVKRNVYIKIENLITIADVLGVTMSDILGLEKTELPEDIKFMEQMLLDIPPRDRMMIEKNIKNYYEVNH